MAIYNQEEQTHQKGHLKSIDESGIEMIFNAMQKSGYSFPIKSTVREILCNGIDSISEKKVAMEILSGKAKVEDYFVEREGEAYRDSRFDGSYYDLKWLSTDNRVQMQYIIGTSFEKDKVIFSDNGVGLGGRRLEKYFSLGFSTKRLSKLPLGKFGIGAKSPLSVGVSFYTIENRYNGRLYRFNVYLMKVDSIIPKFNMVTGQENEFVLFNAGTEDEYPVYYEKTTKLNGVSVIVEAKKHHKQQYIDAVKSQMLYFDNLQIDVVENGLTQSIPYKAEILYEDDMIVMSDNNYYSKPHLLLNKVNYGYIAWEELELEEKNGNIGIKVAPEDVEVTPSRESVMWTEITKEKVLQRFNQVVDIAAEMIQKELQSTDLLTWLKNCYSVYNKYSERSGILGRLAKIVDLNKAKFKFLPNPNIVFDSLHSFPGLFSRIVIIEKKRTDEDRVMKKKVSREEFSSMGPRLELPIYLMSKGERASNLKDKYLYTLHPKGFLTVMEPYQSREEAEKDNANEAQIKKLYSDNSKYRLDYWEALKTAEGVLTYNAVEVPEDFTGTDEEEDVAVEEGTVEDIKKAEVAKITAAERRKEQGKTLIYSMESVPSRRVVTTMTDGVRTMIDHVFSFKQMEISISSINQWDASEIYYGHEKDSELMCFIAAITRDPGSELYSPSRRHAQDYQTWMTMKWYRKNKQKIIDAGVYIEEAYRLQHFFDCPVMLIKTAQNNKKLYRDFKRVEEFFISIQNNVITMSNSLIKWNTARLIKDKLSSMAFLYNFPFNQDYADMYEELYSYVHKHYRTVEPNGSKNGVPVYGLDQSTYTDMIQHLDAVYQFQNFVSRGANSEDTAKLAEELFSNREIQDGMAVDPYMLSVLEELEEYVQACGSMLNYMPVLTGHSVVVPGPFVPNAHRNSKVNIPELLELEIKTYLEQRGVLNYESSRYKQREQDRTIEDIGVEQVEKVQFDVVAFEQ